MNKQDLIKALSLDNFSTYYQMADATREKNVSDVVQIRAILEFSNYCKRDCSYCGINCTNKSVDRYRMTPQAMVDTAQQAADAGYKTLVMQSGDDAFYNASMLGDIVKEIKKTGMKITLSCGEKSYEDYKHLFDCGADRYLLKHETSDPHIYKTLHPNSDFENRINCLRNLKQIGYEVGSGFMIGLPNQTLETTANDILLLNELECDMAGIGPFIAHSQTKLKNHPNGSTELTKRAVALSRIIMPKINLPATTSLGVINAGEKNDIFSCGANVVMLKVTPTELKSKYEIYPATLPVTDIVKQRQQLEKSIIELNRIPL